MTYFKQYREVEKMRDNRDEVDYIKVDIKSFQDMARTIEEQENEIEFLQKQNTALKLRCSKYCLKIKALEEEIADMKFTHKYLTSEEAGKAFARSLLGHRMTPEDVAIDEAENAYVPYVGDDF